MDSSYNASSTKPLYRGTQVVWYILGLIEVLLGLRFILKLLAANPLAGFTSFIYGITGVLAAPFLSVFHTNRLAGSVLEWGTLLGMLIYWLVAWGIIKIFLMSKAVSTPEAASKLDQQEK